jgi:hypothetical protein
MLCGKIMLRNMIFAHHWTSKTPRISKKIKKAKKNLKAKPKVQNIKFQNIIIFSPDLDHLEII